MPRTPPCRVRPPRRAPYTEQKKAMVFTIFLGKQGKRVYAIGLERRVYTIEPQTRKKRKKGGFPQWWCILSSSLSTVVADLVAQCSPQPVHLYMWEKRAPIGHGVNWLLQSLDGCLCFQVRCCDTTCRLALASLSSLHRTLHDSSSKFRRHC